MTDQEKIDAIKALTEIVKNPVCHDLETIQIANKKLQELIFSLNTPK